MKTSYILDLKSLFIMLICGFAITAVCGLIFHFPVIKRHLALKNLSNFLQTILVFATFMFSILYINLGEFRLFLLIGYAFGIILERITLGKLFAKGYVWVYNKLEIFYKRFKSSKLGGIIFK